MLSLKIQWKFWRRDHEKFRFILVGGWNTLIGYFISIAAYATLKDHLHVIIIAAIANIISISNSFIFYKAFVFRIPGPWVYQYLRSFVTYGGSAIFGIFTIWVAVDLAGVSYWVAQGLVILITIPATFILHKRFTFSLRTDYSTRHEKKAD
jgi:putative flippase GtrA